jgi:peptide deformylase
MSILKVARMGHPVLREVGRPLDKADLRKPPVQKLIDDMIETMHEYSGVGLAAPQVHYSLRVFVALLDEDPDERTGATVIVNPEISALTATKEEGWEGCLSIPDIRGMVPRFTDILVRGLDREGRSLELRLKRFAARVAQHETDHLDGVLFFDRMRSLESLAFLDEFGRFWADAEEEEEEEAL